MTEPHQDEGQTILFFDGVCGLCNKTVDFLLKADGNRRLRFAPLQGETAARLLPEELVKDLDTVVLWHRGDVHLRSRAVLNALVVSGWPWCAAGVFKVVPRVISDAAYRLVAGNRYRWFGKREACRLPTAEERASFLP